VKSSPASMYLCSSSPAHSVGRVGKSVRMSVLMHGGFGEAPEPTVRFRGSQKSKSCSEMTDRGYGDGDGESEGQDVADRSSLALPLLISEFGWKKTGVMGGDPHRAQSPPARFSDWTSPWQPSFTPSNAPSPKNTVFTGVGRMSQLDGLLMALPEADKGGVDG